jgi:hypothetical protein
MTASPVTAGPWRVGDAGATVFGPPNGNPSPETIARVTSAPLPSQRQIANARLIAAAPELKAEGEEIAAALRQILDYGQITDVAALYARNALRRWGAVIAKTEGK